ncbi:hypothetical protein MJO29_009595 [Puccinia striiformis f. sp. tritici]|nr:hypothetical protein Pst134EB_018251 [Puccinia striiformis f. sp. tritici]KAI7950921.1 hypothetical protein MJO29_009595 [Puccinia striiformis f. sp. tritici]
MKFDSSPEDRHHQNVPLPRQAEMTPFSGFAIGDDSNPMVEGSSRRLSSCSGSEYSCASQKQGQLVIAKSSGISRKFNSAHLNLSLLGAPQDQAHYLEMMARKLRTELARVRDSTTFTDLSNSLQTLSTIERELASKFESPTPNHSRVSRHFTQLQVVYDQAFSKISEAVSGEAGSHSDLSFIKSTLEGSIDEIAKEYEMFILSLEAQLNNVAVTPTQPNMKKEILPLSIGVKNLSKSSFSPSANRKELSKQREERLAQQLQIRSSGVASKDVLPDEYHLRLDQRSDRATEAEMEKSKGGKCGDLTNALELVESKQDKMTMGVNKAHWEIGSESQEGGRPLTNFRELQVLHAATVEELEQVRAQYLSTLKDLDEMTTKQEQARLRAQSPSSLNRRPSLASLTNSYSTPSINPAAFSSSPVLFSPVLFSPLRSPVPPRGSPLVSQRSFGRQDSGRPKNALEEDEELLETISVGDHTEQLRIEEEIFETLLPREGSFNRPMSVRSPNARDIGPIKLKRTYSNSRTSTLQPLALPLMRSSSLSLSQVSLLQARIRPLNSPSPRSSGAGFSSSFKLESKNDHQAPQDVEQSRESLEKEVLQLQQALKEREEEIRVLESEIQQAPRLRDTLTSSPKSDWHNDRSSSNGYARISISQIPPSDAGGGRQSIAASCCHLHENKEDNFLPSAISCEICQALPGDPHPNPTDISDHIKNLNVLMRSMAKKESVFLENIRTLKSQLASTEGKFQDLVKLSADQVMNMSSEIEALHERLKISQTSDPRISRTESMSGKKPRRQATQDEKSKLAAITALKEEQKLALERLKAGRGANSNQLFTTTSERLMAKEEELKQLEVRWQAKLKAELTAQADLIWAQSDNQQGNLVKTQIKSFQLKSSRDRDGFNNEIDRLTRAHSEEIVKLKEEMNTSLEVAKTDFSNRIQELELLHAQKLVKLTSSTPLATVKIEDSVEGVNAHEVETWQIEKNQLESRNYELENEKLYLTSEHEMRLEQLKLQHARDVSELERRIQMHTLKEARRSDQPQILPRQNYPTLARSVGSSDVHSGRDSPAVSVGANSMIDSAVLELGVTKQMDDEGSVISKLAKKLAHCEGNLKANISAVAHLEDALNDVEQDLRRSKMQMSSLVQERDKLSTHNQKLKMELDESNAEIVKIKRDLRDEKTQSAIQLNQTKLAKEAARTQLETRMLEVQKTQSKRSSFNCF